VKQFVVTGANTDVVWANTASNADSLTLNLDRPYMHTLDVEPELIISNAYNSGNIKQIHTLIFIVCGNEVISNTMISSQPVVIFLLKDTTLGATYTLSVADVQSHFSISNQDHSDCVIT
jgi:hypothetical protein